MRLMLSTSELFYYIPSILCQISLALKNWGHRRKKVTTRRGPRKQSLAKWWLISFRLNTCEIEISLSNDFWKDLLRDAPKRLDWLLVVNEQDDYSDGTGSYFPSCFPGNGQTWKPYSLPWCSLLNWILNLNTVFSVYRDFGNLHSVVLNLANAREPLRSLLSPPPFKDFCF